MGPDSAVVPITKPEDCLSSLNDAVRHEDLQPIIRLFLSKSLVFERAIPMSKSQADRVRTIAAEGGGCRVSMRNLPCAPLVQADSADLIGGSGASPSVPNGRY